MTELSGHGGVGGRPPIRRGAGPKVRVVVGVSMGAGIALAAVWALMLAAQLLLAPDVGVLSKSFWWAVFCGVVVACGLATPVALRLWKGGAEGLRGFGPDRDRASLGRGTTLAPAVATRDGGRAERRLLQAIERHGEVTPVRAALEAALTVAEADRMLGELAEKGHLEVRAREGKLFYSL